MTTAVEDPVSTNLRRYLFERHLPLWRDRGWDQDHGGFHERLDRDGNPVPVGFKRLLVQCRQLYSFSHAALLSGEPSWAARADEGFDFLARHYWDDVHGGWMFSVSPEGHPHDRKKDCYGHAFVIFALAYFHRALGRPDALELTGRTLELLVRHLADRDGGGFHDAAQADWTLIPGRRRQNPHMHLLEALLAAYETTLDPRYREGADDIVALMQTRFIRERSGTLGEYYEPDWTPHHHSGHIVEPGHHFEWAWLLHQYARVVKRGEVLPLARRLYEWACRYGIDPRDGGIHDEVDHDGMILRETRRIWPVTEYLKASSAEVTLRRDPDDLSRLHAAVRILRERYLLEDGRWREHLDAAGRSIVDDLPGSTSYHLFQGITEALRALRPFPEPQKR